VGNTNTLASRASARATRKGQDSDRSRVPVITTASHCSATGTGSASSSSVQYLDVGLTLEVQPTIYQDGDVAIKMGLEVSSITNTITTPQGTTAYTSVPATPHSLAAERRRDADLGGPDPGFRHAQRAGIPGLSQIPIVGRLFGSTIRTGEERDRVVGHATYHPHAPRAASDSTEFWYGTESRSRSTPFGGVADSTPFGAGLRRCR